MAEMVENSGKHYASKSVAGTGLGFGIAGTALALLNGGLGNMFGGGSNAVANAVDKDLFWLQNVGIQKSIGDTNTAIQKGDYDTFIALNSMIGKLQESNAAIQASLPIYLELCRERSERYADNKIAQVASNLNTVALQTQAALAQKVDGVVGLPWSSIISGIPTMPQYTIDVVKASSSTTSTTTTTNP
jgi:hypothetical protein